MLTDCEHPPTIIDTYLLHQYEAHLEEISSFPLLILRSLNTINNGLLITEDWLIGIKFCELVFFRFAAVIV